MAASSNRPRRGPALLLGRLLLLLGLFASLSMGQEQHQHEIAATADQHQQKQDRPRSDGSLRRLQRAPRTRPPTPHPTLAPTYKPLTRRPTPVPDPNAPTRAPRRTREPTAAPEFFEPGSGSVVEPSTINTDTGGGGATTTTTGTVDAADVDANLPHTPAPTPLPPPPPGGPSVDGAVGDITKAFDWSPVIYASVATGILVVVLITIAVMVRVLRVRTPLTPSIAPSDMGASLRSSGVGVSASHYSSQFSIEDIEPSRQGLPAATSASALHSPRTTGSGGSGGSPGGCVDASLSATTADLR